MRGVLPETKKHKNLIGNCNYWTIASIKSLIENKTETDIHFEWAERWLPNSREDFKSLGQVEYLVNHTYDLFSISKPRVPADFN